MSKIEVLYLFVTLKALCTCIRADTDGCVRSTGGNTGRWTFPSLHYENMPMQHTAIFHGCKNDNFQLIFFDNFHIFAQNIDCGYTLEPPH